MLETGKKEKVIWCGDKKIILAVLLLMNEQGVRENFVWNCFFLSHPGQDYEFYLNMLEKNQLDLLLSYIVSIFMRK